MDIEYAQRRSLWLNLQDPGAHRARGSARKGSGMNHATTPLGVVVVGYGYWGPNIVRNVIERPELELLALCEMDPLKTAKFTSRYPGVPTDVDFDEVLADPRVDAVSIATPPRTHHALVKQALEAGKHVLVEKPLATTVADAEELVELADERGLMLMPGHTFLYSPPVNKIHQLIKDGRPRRHLLRHLRRG